VDAREGFVQVQPGRGGRALGVAVGDGTGDGGVFGGTLREALVVGASEASHASEVHARALDCCTHVRTAAQTLVERRVELGDEGVVTVALRVIVAEGRSVDGGEAGCQFGEAAARYVPGAVAPSPSFSTRPATFCDAARGNARGLLVEGRAQFEEGRDIVGLDLAHDKSARATLGREPGGHKPGKGFAHGSATHPESPRLLNLGQRGTGSELALDNLRPQSVERTVGGCARR
jgi:hypothetical protein